MAYQATRFSVDKDNVLPSGPAYTALAVGDLVYMDSSGNWVKAVSVTNGATEKNAQGVIVQDALQYAQVNPVRVADIDGYSALTIGAEQYLSTVAGARTATAPTATIRQKVGYAFSATEIHFDVQSASASYTTSGAMSVISVATTSTITTATNGSPLAVIASAPGVSSYTTTSITSGEATGHYIQHAFTGAAGTGWGLHVVTNVTNVALGAYANSIYGVLDLKTSGSVAGLGSAICAEIIMPGAAMAASGTYACLELELGCPTSWAGTNAVAFINATVYGATAANFDTYGFLFDISGVTKASGKFFQDNTAGAASQVVRCRVNGTAYYLMLTSVGA